MLKPTLTMHSTSLTHSDLIPLLQVITLFSPWSSSHSTGSVAALVSCHCLVIVAAVIVFGLGGIVSVVCSIILSKACKSFMGDLMRAATSPHSTQ